MQFLVRPVSAARLSLALTLFVLFVASGCAKYASLEEINRWVAKTQMRHGGIPPEALPRDAWKPLDLVNYELGPGDVVDIRVLGHEEYSIANLTIPPGGIIPFPQVGSINVKGLTSTELQQKLEQELSAVLREPRVLVTLIEYSRYTVSVIGSVQKPGRFPIDTDSRILDMIVAAGGLTLGGQTGGLAPGREMFIYRKVRDNPAQRQRPSLQELFSQTQEERDDMAEAMARLAAREGVQTIAIPVSDLVIRARWEYNIALQPDDIIYIPPAGSVIVMGRTQRPGLVSLGPSVHTLTHALTIAGGLRYGASSRVEVVRDVGPGREPDIIAVHARRMWARKLPDLPLRDGDQVYVRTNAFRAVLEFIGDIFRRGTQAGLRATYGPAG